MITLCQFVEIYPILIVTLIFITTYITDDVEHHYLLYGMIGSSILNHILKYLLLIMATYVVIYKVKGKDYLPIVGYLSRPYKNGTCITDKSYGMPSGHAQLTMFFSTYMVLWLYDQYKDKYISKMLYVFITCVLSTLVILISILRIVYRRHTIEQVIIGNIIGGILAVIWYDFVHS